jgi:predicted nucleotidyltransferase
MKHATDEHRAVAAAGTILRCLTGSGIHGLSIGGQDDRDEMGVCIEPPEYVIGLRQFEQYEYHTAWERPGGRANRSGPEDLDEVVYSLRKYMRLALQGNPTILLPLFAPERYLITITGLGRELRELTPLIVSRQAGDRFAGYLNAQRRSLLSHDGKGRDVTRPELIEAYGFDTKYCAHMIRLGLQGEELMETGRITLPVPEPWRTTLRQLRTGGWSMQWALDRAAELEQRIKDAVPYSPLREQPARSAADDWLVSAYQRAWKGSLS